MRTILKIGRDSGNDIIINEPRVSRYHAIITKLGTDSYEIKDLRSSNGTFVNGKRVLLQIISPADKVAVADCLVNWYEKFIQNENNLLANEVNEQEFAKIKKTITVGASPENDIVIAENFVSNHHAKISLLSNGNYYIQDLGSSNGTFINGQKVFKKNFTKTDVVKIAATRLPSNWFNHNKLQTNFLKDHKKQFIIILSFLLLASFGTIYYYKSCQWFNCNCNLSIQDIQQKNKKSLVYIQHSYYYTLLQKGKKYYVGKNKVFKFTEANTDLQNLNPYATTCGSGIFINNNGTILTAASITNPWLNEKETTKMMAELKDSRTFNLDQPFTVCGETAELTFLQNESVNNLQNYTSAFTAKSCDLNQNDIVTIHPVKKVLPSNNSIATIYYNTKIPDHLHQTEKYYYCTFNKPTANGILLDSIYTANDSFKINSLSTIRLNNNLPKLNDGTIVLNQRGELTGIIQNQQIIFLHQFINQLKN